MRHSDRSNKGVPPSRFTAGLSSVLQKEEEPKNFKEAMQSLNKSEWQSAVEEEMKSLKKNGTWKLIDPPQEGRIIGCKWVFKLKKTAEGAVSKYKARLVAQGFSQKFGIDYEEVFAPVVRQTTFRTLLAIAGKRKMFIYHYDVKTAFLNGDLKETILMKQPEGFEVLGKEHMVCQFNKSLYGLKQAAKAWNEKLHKTLLKHGFVQGQADPCLYTKFTEQRKIFLISYVDDLIMASKSEEEILQTGEDLGRCFSLINLGRLHHYLGIQIDQSEEGIFSISQPQYIDEVLKSVGLSDAKISKIPVDTGYVKSRKDEEPMEDNNSYRKLIGKLLYIAVNTRPDISDSVSILSQHNVGATESDWNEAKRIILYLKGTRELKLKLRNSKNSNEELLIGYADADWAANRKGRKSNSGYLFKFQGAAISWASRKQDCVALSSTEAEYIALAEARKEAIWLKELLGDYGKDQLGPITILEDNQGCLKIIENKKFSNRTKHISTKFHYARDLKKRGLLEFRYCPTEFMVADMLTKPLNHIKLSVYRKECGLI